MQIDSAIRMPCVGKEMIDATAIEGGRAPNHSMNFIPLLQQQFCQVRTVLASDAGDDCLLFRHFQKTTSIPLSNTRKNPSYTPTLLHSYTRTLPFVQFLTSWDDGYVLDLKVADLLDRYNAEGTFYICPHAQHSAEMLSEKQIHDLSNLHTIGAHSLTHPRLTLISKEHATEEIRGSKKWVEEATGKLCTMFCYPYGDVNVHVRDLVEEAGFHGARTTKDLEFSAPDPFLQPVTLQIFPFPWRRKMRLGWKMFDPLGPLRARYPHLRKLKTPHSAMGSWLALAKYLFGYAKETNQPFFHLYGHSREVEKYGMWGELEEFLRFVQNGY